LRPTIRTSTPARAPLLAGAVAAALVVFARPALAQDTTSRPGVSVRLSYSAGTRPGVIVLPVAGAFGDSVRAILQRDFEFGDRVTVISGAAADSPASGGRLNYDLARRLGAAGVVQATVTAAGQLTVSVHDVARRAVLATRDFPLGPSAPGGAWRMSVHQAADEIERWITGVRGIAATQIAFVRDRRVWVIDSDGENARAVTDRTALSPSWHPTRRAIAYSTLTERGRQQIVARDLDGAPRVLTSAGVTNITPAISPDGETVVFAHGEEAGVDLYAVPWGGGATRRVTAGRGTLNVSPSFSPDGRRIAFTSGRSGHPEVYITDADGTNADLLTAYDFGGENYRSSPDWAPDGRAVAFQSRVGGEFQVHTINLRDRSVRRLTSEGRNEDPAWAPDSRHVVVASTRTGSQQLFVVDAETGRARQLTRGAGGARMAAWSPPVPSGRAP
jgi:TolB protein